MRWQVRHNGRMRAYLDHAATTALRPAAREAFLEAASVLGNPTSVHTSGRRARAVLDEATGEIAELLGVSRSWLILTSGGTEADNLAVRGAALGVARRDPSRCRVVVGGTEHSAVLETAQRLEAPLRGEVAAVTAQGHLDRGRLEESLAAGDVSVLSAMLVNNETGALEDVEELGQIAHRHGALMHTDAVQGAGHVPLPAWDHLDMMSITAHKLGGPVGIGALVARPEVPLAALTTGGGQQRGIRSGTLDAAHAAAFAAALREALRDCEAEHTRLRGLADALRAGIAAIDPSACFTLPGDAPQSGHIVHVGFPGADAESLLFLLDERGVDASAGSACHAGVARPSHVLEAMHLPWAASAGSLRLSLGWTSTHEDVEAVLAALPEALRRARAVGALTRGGFGAMSAAEGAR